MSVGSNLLDFLHPIDQNDDQNTLTSSTSSSSNPATNTLTSSASGEDKTIVVSNPILSGTAVLFNPTETATTDLDDIFGTGDDNEGQEEFTGFDKGADDDDNNNDDDDDEELFGVRRSRKPKGSSSSSSSSSSTSQAVKRPHNLLDDDDEEDEETARENEKELQKRREKLQRDGDDDDDDEEEELDEDGIRIEHSKKKSRKDTSSKKGKKPKSQKSSGSGDDDSSGSKKEKTAFDEILENIKKKKVKREKLENFSQERLQEIRENIKTFIDRMRKAARDDLTARDKKMPALQKLKMLSDVENEFKKVQLHDLFIEYGALGALADWLLPFPDDSLPHESIRSSLLALIDQMNLADMDDIDLQDSLRASQLGKAVFILTAHKDETLKNKKLAKSLVDKWSRSLFNLNATYEEEKISKELSTNDLVRKAHEQAEKALKETSDDSRTRARVPQVSNRSYTIRPRVSDQSTSSRPNNHAGEESLLNSFSQKMKNQKSKSSKFRQQAVSGIVEAKHCIL